LCTGQGEIGSLHNLPIDFVLNLLKTFLIDCTFVNEESAKAFHRITLSVARAFFIRPVKLFIVGK
jgi:hypothetical protein